jgi:hypothetical protein
MTSVLLWCVLFLIAASVTILLATWPAITPPEQRDDRPFDVEREGL